MPKLTYKTRLLLSAEDNKKLLLMLEAQRLAWNECSVVKFKKVPKNSIVDLHKKFYKKFRKKNPDIPAQVVISAEQSVLATYRSVASNKHKITQPPEKKKLSIRLDARSYSYKNGIFSIISLGRRVKCEPHLYPKLKELFAKYKFCDPLLFVRNDEVWMAVTFDVPEVPSCCLKT